MRNPKLKRILLSTVALLAVAVAVTSFGPVVAGQKKDEKADPTSANNLPTKKSGR